MHFAQGQEVSQKDCFYLVCKYVYVCVLKGVNGQRIKEATIQAGVTRS